VSGGMQLKEYWAHGKGAAKIQWGVPGDFLRCVAAVTEEVGPAPEGMDVKGYCNILHRMALGVAPGQEGPKHAAGFKESLHPRDAQGQWTVAPGGGGRVPNSGVPYKPAQMIKEMQDGDRVSVNGVEVEKRASFYHVTIGAETRKYSTPAEAYRAVEKRAHLPEVSTAVAAAGPALPDLVTLPGVDIVAAGRWKLASGEQTFTTADLRGAVQAAQCPAVGPPIIKIGHVDPHFDGEPALGHVANMTLAAEGNKITGDLAGMPAWLAAAAPSAYPRRSIEGVYDFQCSIGHTHPFVITGLALLGVTAPGVGVLSGLPKVAALYGVAAGAPAQWRTDPQGGDMPGQVQAAAITELDVRRAYYEASGVAQTFWITELQMDPAQLIVADEATSKVYRVPFHINASSGEVQFDDPQEVAIRYEDLGALAASRGSGAVVAYASAAASRALPQAAAEDHGNIDTPDAADLDTAARRYAASQGWAMPDGSYPVRPANLHGASDLEKAVGAVGRGGGSHDAIRKHIMARAQAIGLTAKVPDNWGGAGQRKAASGDPGIKVDAAGRHGAFTGTHSHPHAAMGVQGGDQSHDHSHTHDGSGSHAHVHAAGGTEGGTKVDFTDEQMTALRAALGLGDDDELTPDRLVRAAGSLREQADKKVMASGPLPPGVIAVDQEAWDEVNKKVGAAEAFRSKVMRGERDQVIAAAISAGKFPPARKGAYERLWDADPENTRAVIASLRKNAVPVEDVGVAGGADDEGIDEDYRTLFPPDLQAASARPAG
jgi:hypothetical protein